MAKIKVGINGMGRIGRTVMREWLSRCSLDINNIEVVACNNPGITEKYVHLLKYDSVHGIHPTHFEIEKSILKADERSIKFFNERNPSEIPWSDEKVDIVIDATGVFKDGESLGQHLGGTVKKVIMCAPGKNLDGTFVMGINNNDYNPDKHHIISNASCTTNCLAPTAQVLHEKFGIVSGFMCTVHAYTLDQHTLDSSHKDFRRMRAAAINIIPTTTGAAKATGLVIPELKGKLNGHAVRVPTADVSMIDLTVNLEKEATPQEINQAFKEASETDLKGILGYCDLELVSQDFRGRRESSIIDAPMTDVIGKTANIVAWYDNEIGFSNRVIDLARFVGEKL